MTYRPIKKAIIFSAGYGKRLGELTKSTHKSLVPLSDGTTMLQKVIERLKKAGVQSIIINLHYLADQIKDYLNKNKNFEVEIHFSLEEKILGTGGGLKKTRWFFDDKPFYAYNSDVFCDLDLKSLHKYHEQSNSLVTLAVMERETSRPLIFDKENKLIGYGSINNSLEKGKPYGFCGIQVIDPKFFLFLEKYEGEFSTIPVFFNCAKAQEKVSAYLIPKKTIWIDMGTPENLNKLQQILQS